MQKTKLGQIITNTDGFTFKGEIVMPNPQTVTNKEIDYLITSLLNNPQLYVKRLPICVKDDDGVLRVIGGNKRIWATQKILDMSETEFEQRFATATENMDKSERLLPLQIWSEYRASQEIPYSDMTNDYHTAAQVNTTILADNAHYGKTDMDIITSFGDMITLPLQELSIYDYKTTDLHTTFEPPTHYANGEDLDEQGTGTPDNSITANTKDGDGVTCVKDKDGNFTISITLTSDEYNRLLDYQNENENTKSIKDIVMNYIDKQIMF